MSDGDGSIGALRAALAAAEARAEQAEQRLDAFLANMPGIVWENYFEQDPARGRVTYVSGTMETLLGYTASEWMQPHFWFEIVHPEDRERAGADTQAILAAGHGTSQYRSIAKDGRTVWVTVRISVIRDEHGAIIGLRGVTLDVTDLKLAEAERNQALLREQLLRAQQESLLSLTMPLVPISDELLAMTLVGTLDERRADRMLTTLLDGVAQARARTVILDVTAVPDLDNKTADALIRAARALSLLGAEVVLTGIQPEVARTLVELGADLRSVIIRSTLKAGIAYAMQKHGGTLGASRAARQR